jgi:tetratricopeptide (TPR) repeat protein
MRARRPDEPRLLLLSARAEAAAGDAAAAVTTLQALLAADGANVEGSVLLAEILAGRGQPDEARQVLDRVLTRRPDSMEAQLTLARLFEATGQPAAAQAVYERLLVAQPHTPTAAYRLAALYLSMNERLDRALDLARLVKQALPEDPAVSDLLGWAYVRQGLHGPAVSHLQDAVRKVPANATYRYHLGMAYVGLGQHDNARRELTRALQLDPGLPEAAALRAALATLPR